MQVHKKVGTLIEQTVFLIEQQKEALSSTENLFTIFANSVREKTKESGLSSDDLKSLNNIGSMISEKLHDIKEDMLDDIDFLEKQLETLKTISDTSDANKAQAMLDMILDEEEEKILDTEEFKAGIKEDTEIAAQDLAAVIKDLTEALNEGSIRDVELLLETMGSEGEIEVEFEGEDEGEELDDDKCDSCESSCCKSNKNGKDIFSGCCRDSSDSRKSIKKYK